jgi:SPP1 gp7 family putative phage head morphogenesis protein
MDLGASGVGSYALSKDQSRFFMDSMDALAKDIQGAIGEQAIKQLVDLNFTVKEYPKLVHGDLGSVDIGELASAIQTLSFVGTITPDTELEKYLRTIMKLPDMAEETERERERPKEPKQKDIEEEPEEPKQMSENTRWRRDLTKPELRVRFEEIEDMMDYEEARLYKELSKILLKEKAYLLPIFERAVREGDLATLQSVAGKFTGEYERVFRNGIKKIFEFGKSKASFEIGEAPPQTAPEMSAELQDKAHYYAQRGYEDLVKVLTASASVAILKNLPEKEGVKEVSKAFNSYLTKNAKVAANLIISENLNEGRKYAFDTYKENVYAYQWSAILDGGTCNYCQSMDGRTISATDQRYEEYQPGRVHFNCRCIWVAILKDEEPAPIFTGIPDSLQPQTRVPPWDFEDLSRPLADAVPIDVEERLYAHEEEPHGNH